ncbi:polysaccharide biosynthesis/export family protein [Dyadobacter arcticus]|uniref:Protein involved in polysaccharide export with SLBB domain n=1 Tax=Dyadobacter arcticus TaxID=1078754 RepID=A0ABX0UEZ2_9BACT|nr:SLBB domain-containing protein [Dyadobacter arcticus]NIJ51578.1 protein involved in polysaccharide export with SLBB domain [Dyadobacter arcticus]
MHYQSQSKKYLKSIFSLFLILVNLQVFAQNTDQQQSPTENPVLRILTPQTDPSQINNQQAVDFYNQAKSSGMSDLDIERAALQRGYTLDQISAMRRRLQQKPDEKKMNDPNRDQLDETRDQDDLDELEDETNNERDSTNSRRAQNRRLNRTFGAAFFSSSSNTFEPNLRIATPRNYILGPEDEIVVDIYGNAVDNFRMKISPEGTVKMLNLAPVYINGLTIEQASERIVNRLRQAYSTLNKPGSGTYSSITLGNVRSIRIMITGEAARPGTYTVSSLATAFNALSLSGGPSRNGSYRNIEIIRNNKIIKKIDLYRFLVDADLRDNISLQDQDIILIRPFENRIELNGQVKRSGIFESKAGENILTLIRYAGGFTPEAYTKSITYQRNTGSNYIIGSFDSLQIESFVPKNGDIFNVKRILDVISNQIEIRGAVTVPGPYALEEKCNTVLELIQNAQGLSPRAFLNRAILERASGDTQTGLIAFDLRKLVNREVEDIQLLAGDILTIKSVEDLKEFTFLSIAGSILNPGNYYYYKDITIADLIFQAGGYMEGGIPYRIEVSRRIKNDTLDLPASQNVRIFTMNVSENLVLNPEDQKFKLQPQDIVIVRKSPRYEEQKTVTIIGEVTYPGTYTIINNFERISDIFPKAGGVKPEAYLAGAQLYRNQELVAVDIASIADKPSLPANLLLIHGDTLVIPKKSETVRIQGGVYNPSVVNFDRSFAYEDYISQAGGYTEQGWKKRAYVTHPNGRTHRTKSFIFFRSFPKVEPGSTVTIPIKRTRTQDPLSRGERLALLSLFSTLAITLIRIF